MNIYISYIKKVFRCLQSLSEQTGYSRLYHLIDYSLALLRHGTLIRQYTIGGYWKLSTAERSKRLTYRRMCRLMKSHNNSEYIPILENKKSFNSYFNTFIHRDWLYVNDVSFDDFFLFARKHQKMLVKPINGVEGGGIRILYLEGKDRASLFTLFNQLKSENVLIEEYIIQHPKMVFGNASVNTIRTMTLLGKDGKGHVVKAMLRAGVGDSAVDNYAMGGSIYEVDVNTGYVVSRGQSKAGNLHLFHPNTKIMMLGYKIPNWDQVIDISIQAAEHIPQVRIVGWDVAISEDFVQLIEGNHNPDYELYEFIGSTGYYEKFKEILQ